jgi:hypothetical protein
MSEIEDRLEYDHVKVFAFNAGFHAEIHRGFKPELQPPGREAACWYLQRSKNHGADALHIPTILKFSTAAEIYDYVLEHKKAESPPNG